MESGQPVVRALGFHGEEQAMLELTHTVSLWELLSKGLLEWRDKDYPSGGTHA